MSRGLLVFLELSGGLAGVIGVPYGVWRFYEWAWCRGFDIGSKVWRAAAERDAQALEEARHGQTGDGPDSRDIDFKQRPGDVMMLIGGQYHKLSSPRIHLADIGMDETMEPAGVDDARYGYRRYDGEEA